MKSVLSKLVMFAALAWGWATGTGAQPRQDRALDTLVATIGHRLAVANVVWCTDRQWLPGVTLGVENPAVASRGGRGALRPTVLALADGGPAARAGLALDEAIETADGAALPAVSVAADGSFAGIEQTRAAFETAFRDGSALLGLGSDGATARLLRVGAEQGCAGRFLILPSRQLNAYANGRSVQITSRLAEAVANQEELAAILAHEFAHHILRHRARLDAAGIQRGLLANFGRNARLIRETEEEADRLSVWLLARAGYDPAAAARFWSWFGRRGLSLLGSPTHGGWRSRVARIEAEIAAMRAAGPGARPPLLSG